MNLTVSQLIEKIETLRAGDIIELTGTIYTARDSAHKKIARIITENGKLPFALKDAVIYYCGPCPKNETRGDVIGSCGPTTSNRMDVYTPLLLSLGVKATIGKGPRSALVVEAIKANKAIYLAATGGAGALLAKRVRSCEVAAFPELGPEAVYKLGVVDFPLVVAIDTTGKDVFSKK
jgi:fumarate hydratase subunit beta